MLLAWVENDDHLLQWTGPGMRYPMTTDTLSQALYSSGWPGFSLVSSNDELLAFGQYYLRLGRCHLCRLIVSPKHRGKGIAQRLLMLLSDRGCNDLGVSGCSLFVHCHNHAAINAYHKYGFVVEHYSQPDSINDCLYMVKS